MELCQITIHQQCFVSHPNCLQRPPAKTHVKLLSVLFFTHYPVPRALLSTAYLGSGQRDSVLNRETQTALSPAISTKSSGGI